MRTWKRMFVVTSDEEMIEERAAGAPPSIRDQAERDAVRLRRVGRLERRWWGRAAINVFLVWQLYALMIWLVPSSSAVVQSPAGVGLVRMYMTLTSLAQSWSMFSPYPDRLDVTLEAQITYRDGSKRFWYFPRMAHMGYAQKYEEERWRKLVEVATHGNNPVLWLSMARYAARANDIDPKNRPVNVVLLQHSRMIPPPGTPMPPVRVSPLETPNGPFVVAIHPEDLK